MFSARASWLLTPPGTLLLCSYIILSSPGHLSPSPRVPAVGSSVKALGTLQESALAHLKSGHLSNQDARELGALEALSFHLSLTQHRVTEDLLYARHSRGWRHSREQDRTQQILLELTFHF